MGWELDDAWEQRVFRDHPFRLEDLGVFESITGFIFPDDYVEFVTQFMGYVGHGCYFVADGQDFSFGYVYGFGRDVKPGQVDYSYLVARVWGALWNREHRQTLIPIAGANDDIALDYRDGPKDPSVSLVPSGSMGMDGREAANDPDFEDEVIPLAANFTEFLGLCLFDD